MERFEMAKAQREIMGMSQKQLADSIDGVSQCYISQYERGEVVKPEIIDAIHKGLTSIRDKMYPEGSYERQIYTLNLHCTLFGKSETFYDKLEYLNKMTRDITYLIQFVVTDKKKAETMQRSESWRKGYRW